MELLIIKQTMKKSILSIALVLFGLYCYAQQLAFPTAEGYGKYTVGGRGGFQAQSNWKMN